MKWRFLAGFSGRIEVDGNSFEIFLPNSDLSLAFEVDAITDLNVQSGDQVLQNEWIATTKKPISFSIKKQGVPILICPEVINESGAPVAFQIPREQLPKACQ